MTAKFSASAATAPDHRDTGIYSAFATVTRARRRGLGREELLAQFAVYEAEQQASSPRMPYPRVLEERVHRRLAKEWGILASDDDHFLFRQSTSNWPVFADAPAALQYLKRFFSWRSCPTQIADLSRLSSLWLEAKFDAISPARHWPLQARPRLFEHMDERLAQVVSSAARSCTSAII